MAPEKTESTDSRDLPVVSVELTFSRDCKTCSLYETTDPKAAVKNLYLKHDVFGAGKLPRTITVTITASM